MASRLAVSNSPIKLADNNALATRVVAAIDVGPEYDMESGSLPPCVECVDVQECQCVAKLASKDRGSVIRKEILAR